MTVGENIKKLRRERNITQEALAEYLGISSQAVSQWECGKTTPDIAQIPVLAYIFGVSADAILGIDIDAKEKHISQIADQARLLSQDGESQEAIRILKEGIRQYPDSFQLMSDYAFEVYYNSAEEELKEDCMKEIVGYISKILSGCTDNRIRNRAVNLACRIYPMVDRRNEALALADSMDGASTRLELLTNIYTGKEKLEAWRDELIYHFNHCFGDLCFFIQYTDEDGNYYFSEEERLNTICKVIAAYKLFYENGDDYYAAQYLEYAYQSASLIYAKRKDIEKCIEYAGEAAKCAVMSDTHDPNTEHTSIILRSTTDGRIWKEKHNCSWNLFEYYRKAEEFSFFRRNDRFIKILEELSRNAK